MKKIFGNILILFLSFSLLGCASNTKNQNAGYGAAVGVAFGALAGNPLLAFGGAVVGVGIGHAMPSSDEDA